MKPVKYSVNDANKIDLGTKIILKYPTPSKKYDIGHMTIDGRFPIKGKNYNQICEFFIYVLDGNGKVFAGEYEFDVKPSDVVFVPAQCEYAVEGKFKYITIDIPAFYPEQSKEIDS